MSVVTLQLGQCGNQIGSELFSTLLEDVSGPVSGGISKDHAQAYREESLSRFFNHPQHSRGEDASIEETSRL